MKYIFESHRYIDTKAGCLISIIVHLDCGISRFVTAIITYSCSTLPPLAAWSSAWPQPRTRQFVIRERCRDVVTARTIAGGDIVLGFRIKLKFKLFTGYFASTVLLPFYDICSGWIMKCLNLNIIGIYSLSRTGEGYVEIFSPSECQYSPLQYVIHVPSCQ